MNLDKILDALAPTAQIQAHLRERMPETIARLRAQTSEHAATAPRREAGYTIHNAADESVVRIYDEIWFLGVNALDLAADLDAITAPKIRVEINSPGGDVWDGIAIYNSLRNHPAHVTTRVDGIAASIASVIAQAGDTRVMVGGSQMMIHNAWGATIGDHADHEDMASILDHQDKVIAGIYAARSGKTPDEFRALMNAETWMTADEAVEHGLADEVFEPPAKAKLTLADTISSALAASEEAVSGVERLVAAHAGAESPLTGTKREGLVALRGVAARIDGLLSPPSIVRDLVEAQQRAAQREAAWRMDPAYPI
jgi:ATP-dependent Clp endopeptidase proteolytic subunit ClpP